MVNEDGQPLSLQSLENGLGLEGRPALGDADELLHEDLSGLGHEDLVQGDEELVLALGREQLERCIVDVDDLDHRDGLLDEFRVGGEVFAEIVYPSGISGRRSPP